MTMIVLCGNKYDRKMWDFKWRSLAESLNYLYIETTAKTQAQKQRKHSYSYEFFFVCLFWEWIVLTIISSIVIVCWFSTSIVQFWSIHETMERWEKWIQKHYLEKSAQSIVKKDRNKMLSERKLTRLWSFVWISESECCCKWMKWIWAVRKDEIKDKLINED